MNSSVDSFGSLVTTALVAAPCPRRSMRGLEPVLQCGEVALHLCPDRPLDLQPVDNRPGRRLTAAGQACCGVQCLAEQAYGTTR